MAEPTSAIHTEGTSSIRILPALVVDQIAAGEVVERPASVVKELLDNAIDAGACRIVVELERGGIELVRVTDDGKGIPAEELALALESHATSKIRQTQDLDRIATMGFRGEALASIAAVSRLTIRSRTPAQAGAARVDQAGDDRSEVRPESGPVGTSVTVRNLFFNTPARRKFLRTPQTEQGHCNDIVRSLALSHPAISFVCRADGRALLDVSPDQSPRERALAIIGGEMESEYLEVRADDFDDVRGMTLWGLAGRPSLARHTVRWQHLFLNGRPIRDKTVQHAIREAYRGLIEPGRHPAVVLMLEMHPSAVDVNVHPTKSEVRFRDQSMVHSAVLRAIREALQRADLTPSLGSTGFGAQQRSIQFEPVSGMADRNAQTKPSTAQRFVDYFNRFVPSKDGAGFDYEGLRRAVDDERERIEAEERRLADAQARAREAAAAELGAASADAAPLPTARRADHVLQVHNSFLVTQDDEGVVIIDQHALHERVMFEKLKSRLAESGALESQRLLMPAVVHSTAQRVELLDQLQPLLEQIGVVATPLGPESIGVQGFPSFLFDRNVSPGPFMEELLERAESEGLQGDSESALAEVLDMMACKAAIKAGEQLSNAELEELLAQRDKVERSSNCPHGRPTAIRLSMKELERQFGRT